MNFHKIIIVSGLLLALIITAGCQAGDAGPAMPEGCIDSGTSFSGKGLIINDGTGGVLNIYLIHNFSKDTIYLNHEPKDNPGASAGWSTELGPGNWTAISINNANFGFTCGKMVPGKFDEVPCKNELKACKFSIAEFSDKAKGSYWVSENKSLDETLETIKSRGIKVGK